MLEAGGYNFPDIKVFEILPSFRSDFLDSSSLILN